MLKIDVFNHIMPKKYLEALIKNGAGDSILGNARSPRSALHNLETRFSMMDRYENYVQIIDISLPPIEEAVPDPKIATELAKIANDEMAELVAEYPDRFVAAIACLPMNNIDAAVKEIDRTITKMRFRGIQINSTIMDKSLNSPEFEPIFERMNHYGLPILIHPRHVRSGPRAFVATPGPQSVEFLAQREFNWPYETSLAMGCIVFSGLLDKYPNLKIITHHCGGIVPYQAQKIIRILETGAVAGSCTTKTPTEYYKMMYGDTALYGNTAALMCGYAFFGADHIVFASDMPFGGSGGDRLVRDSIQSVEEAPIPDSEKKKIFADNARRLFRLPF